MKKIVAAAAFAACLATPALAQDQEKKPFNGPFIGGVLGYDNARNHIPDGPSITNDGLLYGGNIGYDANLGGAIIGVEGEYTDSNTKYNAANILAAGDSQTLRYDRDLYAGLRLGGQVSENLALYAKGGYTNARLKNFYTTAAGTTLESSRNVEGYRLGAGVETTYRGLTGRLEYRYSNYGKIDPAFSNAELERHQVAAVVGYRF
ncbi:MAG: porin family protein [Sphingobium sp.]